MSAASSDFQGRDAELTWLRALWNGATTRDSAGRYVGGPRMAIVLAETGLGKTRLVQELYRTLSTGETWNAPAPYWPLDLHTTDGRLLVNPDFDTWTPDGAPQFLWLGARWQPPAERNVEERTCVLPALHATLQAHVRVVQTHAPAWRRVRRAAERLARQEGVDGFVENAADVSIPFGGLLVKVARAGASLFDARTSAAAETRRMHDSAADALLADLREVFGGFGSGGLALPTVLWLDDAHWIDRTTLDFVHRLWREAVEQSWPLLVVVTHWEREWNEIQRLDADERAASIAGFAGDARVERLVLGAAPTDDLAAWLRTRLPGLTAAQHDLLIDKAGGNFLTLVENVGVLVPQTANFVGRSLDAALTPAGERRVASWESDRHRRIEQRFQEIEPDLQDLLGWSSRVGQRFLWQVPASLAEARTGAARDEVIERLDACVDPYAMLGITTPYAREFRDRALHAVAARYFRDYLADGDEAPLVDVAAQLLAAWVNASVDEDDAALDEAGWPSLLRTPYPEAKQVLDMTLEYLPLDRTTGTWTNTANVAALRASLLRVIVHEGLWLWDDVLRDAPALADVPWDDVPPAAAPVWMLNRTGLALGQVAAHEAALAVLVHAWRVLRAASPPDDEMAGHVLHNIGDLHYQLANYDVATDLLERALTFKEHTLGPAHPHTATTLSTLGIVRYDLRQLDAARALAERALEIWQQANDASDVDISLGLHNLAQIHHAAGAFDVAVEAETHAIERRERALGPDHHTLAPLLNALAKMFDSLGRFGEVEPLQARALAINSRVYGPEHPAMVPLLNDLGETARRLGRFDDADSYYTRALTILERTMTGDHPDVGTVCGNMALSHAQRGRSDLARPLYERALAVNETAFGPDHPAVATTLANLAVTLVQIDDLDAAERCANRALTIREQAFAPDHPDVARSLNSVALLKMRRGDYDAAETMLLRSLQLREQVLGTEHPDLAESLNNLGEIYWRTGRAEDAEAFLQRSLAVRERAFGPSHPRVVLALNNLAQCLRAYGRLDDARVLLARAVAEAEKSGDPTGHLEGLRADLAAIDDERGKT